MLAGLLHRLPGCVHPLDLIAHGREHPALVEAAALSKTPKGLPRDRGGVSLACKVEGELWAQPTIDLLVKAHGHEVVRRRKTCGVAIGIDQRPVLRMCVGVAAPRYPSRASRLPRRRRSPGAQCGLRRGGRRRADPAGTTSVARGRRRALRSGSAADLRAAGWRTSAARPDAYGEVVWGHPRRSDRAPDGLPSRCTVRPARSTSPRRSGATARRVRR